VKQQTAARVEAKDLDGYWKETRALVIANLEKRQVKENRATERQRCAELAAAAKVVRLSKKDEAALGNAALREIAALVREKKRLARAVELERKEAKKRKSGVVQKLGRAELRGKLATYERADIASMPTVGQRVALFMCEHVEVWGD
jgi:hypothetical protein